MKKEKKSGSSKTSGVGISFLYYPAMFIAVVILAALPVFLFGGGDFAAGNLTYLRWYIVYCVILAFVVCVVIAVGKKISVDRPMRCLSEAARKVAGGDFSVYLPMRHAPDKMDYIDMLYADFNKMVAELGSIETLQNDFAANVSHEIKTPLSGINNYLQLLNETELTPEQREYVASALESADRLASLVFNILKLNKLENQSIKPQPEKYDLCRQLADSAIGFESIWEKKEIEFEAEMEDEAYVVTDQELMALVWNNLLSNAFKFTEAGGTVKIRQYRDGGNIVVEVSDTGCGMSKETADHMFDKFYQGDSSHSVEGNGLGMALALRVLQMCDGTISVNSVEGEGSTFTVRLPAKMADADMVQNADVEQNAGVMYVETKEKQLSDSLAGADYIGYEYNQVIVPVEYSSLYADNYKCFGWESDPNRADEADKSGKNMILHFRRNRKLRNKAELTRLQHNFDGLVSEIEMLKRSKTKNAKVWAWTAALIGTVFMAGSTFAVTAEPPQIFWCAVLGAPGIALWILPYFIYKQIVKKRSVKVTDMTEKKYDEIYELCEKGRRLLK